MFEERAEGFIFLHRADEFGQVFEASGRLRRLLILPHRGVAAFVEQLPSEFGMRKCARHVAPAGEVTDEIAERAAGLRRQFVGVEDARGGDRQRGAGRAGEHVELCHRLVA